MGCPGGGGDFWARHEAPLLQEDGTLVGRLDRARNTDELPSYPDSLPVPPMAHPHLPDDQCLRVGLVSPLIPTIRLLLPEAWDDRRISECQAGR